MSWEFCRDVPDPWGRSKSLCKKVCVHFWPLKVLYIDRGSVNSFQTVVRVWSGEQTPTHYFNLGLDLNFNPVLPQSYHWEIKSSYPYRPEAFFQICSPLPVHMISWKICKIIRTGTGVRIYLPCTSFKPLVLPHYNPCSAGNLEPRFGNQVLQTLGWMCLSEEIPCESCVNPHAHDQTHWQTIAQRARPYLNTMMMIMMMMMMMMMMQNTANYYARRVFTMPTAFY